METITDYKVIFVVTADVVGGVIIIMTGWFLPSDLDRDTVARLLDHLAAE